MQKIRGKYNEAVVFTNKLEEMAKDQIRDLCDQPFAEGSRIRIMPDCHAGAGCTIGTTMSVQDKVVPNLVGVDIGCGMLVSKIGRRTLEFSRLDKVIRQLVPSGFAIRRQPHRFNKEVDIEKLYCREAVDLDRARRSIGTLGGGNHFIEVNEDENGVLYLVIHSGSRHMGKQIADHYQNMAWRSREKTGATEKALAWLIGENFHHYLHDMAIAQQYAEWNRKAAMEVIGEAMDLVIQDQFSTIHNYIDMDTMILRKGAIRAGRGEEAIIPLNMKEGSLLVRGKGNTEWNQSAPHGAGRMMSRKQARKELSLEEFRREMAGVYTTSVSQETLDEAPGAYKPAERLRADMEETVDVVHILQSRYNFKASGD